MAISQYVLSDEDAMESQARDMHGLGADGRLRPKLGCIGVSVMADLCPRRIRAARARCLHIAGHMRTRQAANYWPLATGRLLQPVSADYSSPSTGRLRQTAYSWPPTTDRLLLAAAY